jgi:hypothetical protein
MQSFLLWQESSPDAPTRAAEVAARLHGLLAPLFAAPIEIAVRCEGPPSMVVAHLDVAGWRRPFFEVDDERWVQAIEYPVDARGNGDVLADASRTFERDAAPLLRELSPPFSLLWGRHGSDAITVQNDALGQAQLFEYRDDRIWALTNRITALKALGIDLVPVAEEWAAATTLGWFPMDLTGYHNVRMVQPGTQLRVDAHGVRRSTSDVLGEWVHPGPRPRQEWLELARNGALRSIEAARAGWNDAAWAGLTGGYDSRAVVASLRAAAAPFRARVKGHADSEDVKIAGELARIARIPLRHEPAAELPSSDADDWRRSIALTLQWQAGQMDVDKHKTLFAHGRRLAPGNVNVMGTHGEIGRAFYYGSAMRLYPGRALPWNDAQLEDRFVARRLSDRVPFLRADLVESTAGIIRAAYRQSDRYGLTDLARLDFFYLFEDTRRRNAASVASQTGVVVTPLLNPDGIRASFAMTAEDKAADALHHHIVAMHAPEWSAVPYETKDDAAVTRQHQHSRYYDARRFWSETGAALVDEALRDGGFWTEVFDPDAVREHAFEAPDELTMLAMLPRVL